MSPINHDDQAVFGPLVARALAGEAAAWTELVRRLERVVWKSVNMMSTEPDVREDAFAATWLRLAERLEAIREPEKLPGWLATTASNEVRALHRQRRRHDEQRAPVGRHSSGLADVVAALTGDDGDHGRSLVAAERRRDVRRAFAHLDETCRHVLTVLVLAEPPVPYEEASARLRRPVGSLGPTRRRCLDKLRQLLGAANGTASHV